MPATFTKNNAHKKANPVGIANETVSFKETNIKLSCKRRRSAIDMPKHYHIFQFICKKSYSFATSKILMNGFYHYYADNVKQN